MTCAINLAKAWLCVDSRHTCDHRIDASINTMKYLNDPHNGCIGSKCHLGSFQGILVAPYVSWEVKV
jgi:hypothetical protein